MGVLFVSDATFMQSGPAEWGAGTFGLDSLIIPFQGSIDDLEAYLATLDSMKWDPSDIDADMYLASWDSDDNKLWPTVKLKYIGCRSGVITGRTKKKSAGQLLTANFHSSDFTVDLSYIAPNKSVTVIAETDDPPTAPTITDDPIYVYGRWQHGENATYSGPELMAYFENEDISVPESDELVPDKFFSNTITTTRTLKPIY